MASVIYSDNDNVSTAALFGNPLQSTTNYIKDQLNSYVSTIKDGASNLAEYVTDRFKAITDNRYLAKVESMQTRINKVWEVDVIKILPDLASIQSAGPIMQRWVMAHPVMTSLYRDGVVEGYDGTANIDRSEYDRRRVMNGVITSDGDRHYYTNYYEKILDEQDILSAIKKSLIINTWKTINDSMDDGISTDPTSVWNSTM